METKKVQAVFSEHTIARIKRIQTLCELQSEADAVRLSVEVMEKVMVAIRKGEHVLIESAWRTDKLVIPGLNG